jgi:hypothetical protein
VAAAAGACNSISGVNDLDFVEAGSAQAGSGAASSGAPTSGAGATGAGAGGAGGSSCGRCDDPGNDCKESIGQCVDGACVYANLPAGDACDDGDPCTEGDACNASGACVAGPECFAEDPCQLRACEMTGCVDTPAKDGTSCGMGAESERCCAGACTDISSDAGNCGGCGLVCDTGVCQPVDSTPNCDPAPAMTSGRCTCNGITTECPFDGVGNKQVCRINQPQYNNICSPTGVAGCALDQMFIEVSDCPNYCFY